MQGEDELLMTDPNDVDEERISEVIFMIRHYANADDNTLTIGARQLKRKIIRALNECGWYLNPRKIAKINNK